MSSGMDLRKRMVRRDPPKRGGDKAKANPSPLSAIDAGSPGEVRISNDHLYALHHLYHASPSIQAARTVLMSQLLSSGCVVRRDGRDVPLKDTFARHLHDVWVPFAKSVIDHFLQFGFVIVSLEEEAPPPFANFIKGKAMAAQSEMGPDANSMRNRPRDPPDAAEARQTKNPMSTESDPARLRTPKRPNGSSSGSGSGGSGGSGSGGSGAAAGASAKPINLVPVVPDVGQCELSFVYVGESHYRRQYRIFSTNSDSVYKQDFASEVFFRQQPDAAGNICSPIATVFQSASFISALEELALQAEVVRARQMLVTQPITRTQGSQNLDPANLFFDSESRAVQASATAEDDAAQAGSLALQAAMMRKINQLQTTNPDPNRPGGGASAVPSHVPPPLPPNLFACPDRQQVVPGVRPPEARSDLVDIMRCVNDHIAAAMGVPASVIFEGKFSSNSMSQLQLLNGTIQSIAIAVNKVLTATYHAVYDDAKEGDELTLLTAPLCSTAELQSLFEAGVIDIESALPAALHSLGATAVEIAGATKRRRLADQDGTDTKLLEAQNAAKIGDADVLLKAAQTGKTTAETKVVEQQVAKTKAETKKTLHDATAPHVKPGPATSSSSSGGGGGGGGGSSSSSSKNDRGDEALVREGIAALRAWFFASWQRTVDPDDVTCPFPPFPAVELLDEMDAPPAGFAEPPPGALSIFEFYESFAKDAARSPSKDTEGLDDAERLGAERLDAKAKLAARARECLHLMPEHKTAPHINVGVRFLFHLSHALRTLSPPGLVRDEDDPCVVVGMPLLTDKLMHMTPPHMRTKATKKHKALWADPERGKYSEQWFFASLERNFNWTKAVAEIAARTFTLGMRCPACKCDSDIAGRGVAVAATATHATYLKTMANFFCPHCGLGVSCINPKIEILFGGIAPKKQQQE